MRPCACSLRAFELFVTDFAGVNVKLTRPPVLRSQPRTFGTASPFRRPEVTSVPVGQGDDGFLPLTRTRQSETGWREPGTAATSGPKSLGAVRTPVVKTPRELNRLERKKRRIAEGTYVQFSEQRVTEVRVESVVEKIEAVVRNADDAASEMEMGGAKSKSKLVRSGSKSARKEGDGSLASIRKEGWTRKSRAGKEGVKSAVKGAPRADELVSSTRRDRMRLSSKNVSKSVPFKPKSTQMKGIHSKTKKGADPQSQKPAEKNALSKPERKPRAKETWQIQKAALERKFGDQGWQPSKRLSPDTLEGIRALHVSDPKSYSTEILAQHFEITPEAIRRILKSKWRPNSDEAEDRRQRWERRGTRKWTEMARLGIRPPAKWRALGVSSKEQLEKRKPRDRRTDDVRWDGLDETASGGLLSGRIL